MIHNTFRNRFHVQKHTIQDTLARTGPGVLYAFKMIFVERSTDHYFINTICWAFMEQACVVVRTRLSRHFIGQCRFSCLVCHV